jgi:dihydrolipoamide dehydrogenase
VKPFNYNLAGNGKSKILKTQGEVKLVQITGVAGEDDRVPSATYCQPEVAGVGLSEAEAKKRGYDVKVGRFNFGNLAKPRIIGHDGGLVKVVSDAKYDEVLGVHMVGPHATDLIAEACVALQLESTTEEIMRTIHPHPTLSEALMQAAEAVYGHAIDA